MEITHTPDLTITPKKNLHESKSGYTFNMYSPVWALDKDIRVSIESVTNLLNEHESYINVMCFYAENYSSTHVRNINTQLLNLLRSTKSTKITVTMLINFRSRLDRNTEWYLGVLKGFFIRWYELGYSGISDDVIDLLQGWTFKGNVKGDVIKRLDPKEGPLTEIELQAFNEGAITAFEKNDISITQLAIGLSLSHTGRRSIQISHLRIKDIIFGSNKEGEKTYYLNIPRAKQRGAGFRIEFKQFAITKELWAILNTQAQNVISLTKDYLGFILDDDVISELPLFPNTLTIEGINSLKNLKHLQENDSLHIQNFKINETLKEIVSVANIHSERTGELLNISSKRFRYTTGTRAAREGFGELVIAELLDHNDTQNSGVYIENIPEHVASLDQAVGKQLAPYAQAFSGMLIDTEKDAKRAGDINSRIKTNGKGIGSCGNHGFCGANVPIPCYTCINFQPWLDGPHERVRDELIEERERVFKVTNDMQIAAVNDRSILAVQDVIDRCEARREELNNV